MLAQLSDSTTTPNELVGLVLEIDHEFARQDALGLPACNSALRWCAILSEELGEVCEAILDNKNIQHIRDEVIQVAAVAARMLMDKSWSESEEK